MTRRAVWLGTGEEKRCATGGDRGLKPTPWPPGSANGPPDSPGLSGLGAWVVGRGEAVGVIRMPVATPLTPAPAGPTDSTTEITAWEKLSRRSTSETISSVVPNAGPLKQLPMMRGYGAPRLHQTARRFQPVDGRRKPGELRRRRHHALARRLRGHDRVQGAAAQPDARAHAPSSRDRHGHSCDRH